jgi:hypothetical protein
VRDEIFAARVRMASFNPLAGKSELRQFLKLINCPKDITESFNPLAGESELRH